MEEIDLKKVSELLDRKILEIGKNIRKRRVNEGITQQTLAFFILKDKCVISNLERGSCTNVSIHTLIKIAEAFQIDFNDLLKDND